MIAWAAPAFLLAAAAAAVPVVLHLLRRPAGAAVPVPGLRHFEAVASRETGAERLRRWLLLAARCLALGLLAVAFARPVWLDGPTRASLAAGGSGDAAAVGRAELLLVDVSGSTAQVDARGVVAAEAIADAADRRLARLRPGVDAAAVLLVGVGVEPVLPEFSRNLAALRTRLAERLAEPGRVAGVADWRGAVARGGRLAEAGAATLGGLDAAGIRLVVLTDRQASDWRTLGASGDGDGDGAAEVGPPLAAALPNARLSVAGVVAPVGDRPAEVRLRVEASPGDRPGGVPAVLSLSVGGEPVGGLGGGPPEEAAAGWSAEPTVALAGGPSGRSVSVALASAVADGLPADDAAAAWVPAVRRVPVAVVARADPRRRLTRAADASAADYLWRALVPEAERARFDLTWAADPAAGEAGAGVLVLTGEAGQESGAAAEAWAAAGGAAVRFATPGGPGWEPLGNDAPGLVASSAPTPLAAAVLGGLDTRAGEALAGVRWGGRADLRSEGGGVLLRWADGRPAATWRGVGVAGGGVLRFGFALTGAGAGAGAGGGSSLPRRGVFVGLVRGAVDALGHRLAGAAEENPAAPPPAAVDGGDLRRAGEAEVAAAAGSLWAAATGAEEPARRAGPTAATAGAAARAGLGTPLFGWAVAAVAGLVLGEILLQRRAARA